MRCLYRAVEVNLEKNMEECGGWRGGGSLRGFMPRRIRVLG